MTGPEQRYPATAATFHPRESLREAHEGRCPPHPERQRNSPRGRAGAPHGPASPPPPPGPRLRLPPPRRRLRNGRLWLRAAGGWHTAEAAAAGARSEPTTLPPRMTRGAPALTSLVPAADREQPRSRAGREHGKHGGATRRTSGTAPSPLRGSASWTGPPRRAAAPPPDPGTGERFGGGGLHPAAAQPGAERGGDLLLCLQGGAVRLLRDGKGLQP